MKVKISQQDNKCSSKKGHATWIGYTRIEKLNQEIKGKINKHGSSLNTPH